MLKHAWGIWYEDKTPEPVRLRFSPGVTKRVKESIWHPLEKVEETEDGGCIWSVEIAEWRDALFSGEKINNTEERAAWHTALRSGANAEVEAVLSRTKALAQGFRQGEKYKRIVNLGTGGSDLGLFEVNEAAEIITQAAHPDANIIFGAVIDASLGAETRVTVIAAGFDRYEGERRSLTRDYSTPSLGLRADESAFSGTSDDDLDFDDDEFDVPEFLR